MPKRVLTHSEIMPILRTSVERLDEITEGLTDDQLHSPPAPGEWSINDVLAHLRACNDVLGGNMRRILTEDQPEWRAMNPRTWQQKSGYNDWQFKVAFEAFKTDRAELLVLLESLSAESWDRTATVKVPPNKVYQHSVTYYGDWLAGHERAHLRSLERTVRTKS